MSGRVPVSKKYEHLQLERSFRTRDSNFINTSFNLGFDWTPDYLQNNFCPLRFKKMSLFSLSKLDGPQYKVVSSSDILLNSINEKCWYWLDYLKLTLVVNEYWISYVADYHITEDYVYTEAWEINNIDLVSVSFMNSQYYLLLVQIIVFYWATIIHHELKMHPISINPENAGSSKKIILAWRLFICYKKGEKISWCLENTFKK